MEIPTVGAVIRYSYLWNDQARSGQEEGVKNRPCVVIVAVMTNAETTKLLVLPVTHTMPRQNDLALELPLITKNRLGLDDDRSWIVTTEYNSFTWPGPDIRPDASGEVIFGLLPDKLVAQATANLRSNALAARIKRVNRD